MAPGAGDRLTHYHLPCPESGQDYYLVFPKGHEEQAARFLGQNVAVRGSLKGSACSLPLVQVTTIGDSPGLPPCVFP